MRNNLSYFPDSHKQKSTDMAFYLTHAQPTADGGWTIEAETKVRLAGPNGPLAQHILNLPANSNGEWCLGEADILAMLPNSEENAGETRILLWDSGDPDAHPMRVLHFSGISQPFVTTLLVHMELLEPAGTSIRGTGRVTNEALQLIGGFLTPKAKWCWAAPKMAIGSTIVGPRVDERGTSKNPQPPNRELASL